MRKLVAQPSHCSSADSPGSAMFRMSPGRTRSEDVGFLNTNPVRRAARRSGIDHWRLRKIRDSVDNSARMDLVKAGLKVQKRIHDSTTGYFSSIRKHELRNGSIPTERSVRGPRGPYAKSERTQDAILDAAIEVFASDGYRRGSLRNIAERVGISEAGVLHHFSNKEALLESVLLRRDHVAQQRFGIPSADGRATLKSLVELANYNASIPGLVQLFCVLAAEATSASHPAHAHFVQRYAETHETISRALESLRLQEELLDRVHPDEEARRVIALWDGLQIQWLLENGTFSVADLLRNHFNSLLHNPL